MPIFKPKKKGKNAPILGTGMTSSSQKRAKRLRGPRKTELDNKTAKKVKNVHDDTKTSFSKTSKTHERSSKNQQLHAKSMVFFAKKLRKMRFQKRRFRCRGPPKIDLGGDEKRAKTHKKTGFFTKTRFPKTAIPHERSLKNPLLTIKTRWKFKQNFDQKWGQKRLQKYPQDAFKNDIKTTSKRGFQRELRKEPKMWGPLTQNGHFLKNLS